MRQRFNLRWPELRREMSVVLTRATMGVLLSAAVTALGMHYLARWAWMSALVFGVLIAATDPVAVIATFKETGVHGRSRLLVEAESLFNDCTAAVLFAIVIGLVSGQGMGAVNVTKSLVLIMPGAIVCGAIVAALCLLLAGATNDHLVEVTFTAIAAYGSFLLAEHFHMSGVLATLTTGSVKRHKPKEKTALTLKQEEFCKTYISNNGNGVQAAREAGYKGTDETLRQVASENLTKPNIKAFLERLTKEADRARDRPLMCTEETLWLTSLLARASFDDLLDEEGRFDLRKAQRTGAIYAIKKLTFYRSGRIRSVELRDKNASVELFGKHLGLWDPEFPDPRETLARVLGIPKAMLPATLDEPDIMEADAVGSLSTNDEGPPTASQESTALQESLISDTTREPMTNREDDPKSESGETISLSGTDRKLEDDVSQQTSQNRLPVKGALVGYRRLDGRSRERQEKVGPNNDTASPSQQEGSRTLA